MMIVALTGMSGHIVLITLVSVKMKINTGPLVLSFLFVVGRGSRKVIRNDARANSVTHGEVPFMREMF